MVIRELLSECVSSLHNVQNENAMFDANTIIQTVLGISPLDMVLKSKTDVDSEKITTVREWTNRRCSGEPLQYITGVQEFMSLEFIVNPDVLIPRQDTETLVEHVLAKLSGKTVSILDIGTGSGCIPISLVHYNKNSVARGIDISERALETAMQNAKKHNVDDRVAFERKDILTDELYGKYDILVSNPPYIETNVIITLDSTVKDHEPYNALDGGDDGLIFYRRIVKIAPKHLNDGGMLVFEVGHTQADEVANLMAEDFENIEIVKDLCNINRVVSGVRKKD